MIVLGIAEQDNFSSYALIKNGDVLYASEPQPNAYPPTAVETALATYNIGTDKIDSFCYFEKPLLRLERAIESHLSHAPRSFQNFQREIPKLSKDCIFKKRDLARTLHQVFPQKTKSSIKSKILFSNHILSLCSQAFYPSSYEQAAVLCLDDMGEWAGTAIAIGNGNEINIEKEIPYPHSLGYFLDAFSSYLSVPRDQMSALAKQGEPTYARMMSRSLIDLKPDGSFRLNQFYFGYAAGEDTTTESLHELLGDPPRQEGESFTQKHKNIAASVAAIISQAVSLIIHAIARDYRGIHNLCVTGKILQEDFVRDRILRDHSFDSVEIKSAYSAQTLAIGAALAAYYCHHNNPRDVMFLQNLPTAVRR